MKLTKTKLTQLIKEELNKLLAESRAGYDPYHTEDQEAAWNKLQQDDALAALKAKMATGEPAAAGDLDQWAGGKALNYQNLTDAIVELYGTLINAYADNPGEFTSPAAAADDAIKSALGVN
jgi:hypothetical protein